MAWFLLLLIPGLLLIITAVIIVAPRTLRTNRRGIASACTAGMTCENGRIAALNAEGRERETRFAVGY